MQEVTTTPMPDSRRVALVTGGGSGIGRAAALALARDGFSVIIAGRRPEALEETLAQGRSQGTSLEAVTADVAAPSSVTALFQAVRDRGGRLDVLFNNAGTNVPGVPLEDVTFEQWQSIVAANLTGVFLCTQHAFHIMKDQRPMGGRIINNGSISAHAPRPHSAPYTATKHAVTGLTKSTALDGRKYNIACGQIDIGNAETPMAARMKHGVPQADGSVRPEPTMDVEHVARAVSHMANLPLETNILFMTVMATNMPFVGRG